VYNGSKVLVTGGAGFLGSNIARRLYQDAARVWVLDDLTSGNPKLLPKSEKITFVRGSVTDAALLRSILSEVDYVFHFAARNIVLSTRQPESDFRTNVEGTVQLLLNARLFPQIRRIVYASTSSVYGNSKLLPTPEGGYDISVPYAASKMAGELFAIAYAKSFGVPVVCLRFSNVFGRGQHPSNPYSGVVSKFMHAIQSGSPLQIYGDGTQTRDFTFVEDAMNATLAVGLADKVEGHVFNVGTGVETSVNDLARQIPSVFGHAAYPMVNVEKRDIDTVHRRCIDASLLRSVTGWQPKTSVEEGLQLTRDWFLQSVKERGVEE
jgi:UDP-glucose 4-epimerase